MHIPMWRGTYMIFKVVHNMTPGDMTTTITAMKMNKYAKPFNSQFLITVPLDKRKWELCGTNSSTPTASDSSISVTGTEGSGGGTTLTNPLTLDVESGAYNLVFWRYHKTAPYYARPQGQDSGGTKPAYEGVIYEHGTNKILTWTIEDPSDVNRNFGNKNMQSNGFQKFNIVPGGNTWPNEKPYHRGCSSYTVSLSNGKGGFGSTTGASNTMLTNKQARGCLFHPGGDHAWSLGCVLIGQKPSGGRRSVNTSEFSVSKIKTSTNEGVKWYRNFYDHVVPKICAGTTVNLYIKYQEGTPSTSGSGTGGSGGGTPSGGLVSIRNAFIQKGFKDGEDFEITPVYARTNNFMGQVIPGYRSGQNDLYCTQSMLNVLIDALPKFKAQGWKMCILDAFRPVKAHEAFKAWAKKHNENFIGKVIASGYSRHCKGNAVDLTAKYRSNGKYVEFVEIIKTSHARDWNGFDDFDTKSYYCTKPQAKWTSNVNKLKNCMKGSSGINSEYWHFQIDDNSSVNTTTTYD